MSAPWRAQVKLTNQNDRSDREFRYSYPEAVGMSFIRRGKLITLDERPRKSFNFLVNPSTISTSYNLSEFDVTNRHGVEFASQYGLQHLTDGLLSCSYQILLDRTYEVWKSDPAYQAGVLHDVLALEQVAGIPDSELPELHEAIRVSHPGRSEGARQIRDALSTGLTGVLVQKYMRVLFGTRNAFSFDGYLNSLSVDFSHFNYQMIPTRAAVSITMSSFGESNASGGGGAGAAAPMGSPSSGESGSPSWVLENPMEPV